MQLTEDAWQEQRQEPGCRCLPQAEARFTCREERPTWPLLQSTLRTRYYAFCTPPHAALPLPTALPDGCSSFRLLSDATTVSRLRRRTASATVVFYSLGDGEAVRRRCLQLRALACGWVGGFAGARAGHGRLLFLHATSGASSHLLAGILTMWRAYHPMALLPYFIPATL